MKLQSGHEVVPFEGDEQKKASEHWLGVTQGMVRLFPGRWVFPSTYQKFADKLYNYQFKSSDVVVMTYPKCGTTWTQEIVWTMRNNPDLNHPKALTPVMIRSPFIDMDMLFSPPKDGAPPRRNAFLNNILAMCPDMNPAEGVMLQLADAIPDPRTIKCHLPFSLMTPSLLDNSKVVYTARNPKDVIVSFNHHSRIVKGLDYVGTFEEFVQYFVDDSLVYGPYWLHLKEAWEKRDHPNLHFMFYEDLKADPLKELRKLNVFLETNLTEEQLKGIVKYTSFNEMKARDKRMGFSEEDMMESFNSHIVKQDGGFYRKGESGSWKGKLTPELNAKVDQWIQKYLTSFGINFKYGV